MVSSAKDAFKNLKTPELPSDILETVNDMRDSINMVKDNVSMIQIVMMMKMIGKIVDCLKQITDVIGVPSLPPPLDQLPQLIQSAEQIQ